MRELLDDDLRKVNLHYDTGEIEELCASDSEALIRYLEYLKENDHVIIS